MDKEQYQELKALIRPFARAGIPIENTIEAVRAAYLDVKEEPKVPAVESDDIPF